eukprot:1157514-Pelagomonas_calceolata.AAC.11
MQHGIAAFVHLQQMLVLSAHAGRGHSSLAVNAHTGHAHTLGMFALGMHIDSKCWCPAPKPEELKARSGTYPTGALDLGALRTSFERAVEKRLMSDVPFGVLLSGGLDSSLVASVASRKMSSHKWGNKLHSFCIGLPGEGNATLATCSTRQNAAFGNPRQLAAQACQVESMHLYA